MATCLSIVNAALTRLGFASVAAAVGSDDLNVRTMVALSTEEGQELAARYPWTGLQGEATFTTVATEIQGAIETLAPGMAYIVNDTIWNRSLRRPVFGPRTPQEWQQNKAFAINGPWSSHRIQGGTLRMYPVPTAGETCYFEYISRYWCESSAGDGQDAWAADEDVPVLDAQLIQLGTIWRYKKLKGFEYGEDFATYERRVTDAMARDGGKDWLSLSNTKYDIFPGVVVPAGSWNL